jgi:ParB-like chromosome segregation protein Spo0J
MKQIKTISIKCETSETLEIAEMTEMQGGLKERTDIDYDKIKLSICKFGFSFPFFIWKNGNKNYLIDGHGRFATLCKMQKDGYIIPPLPVVYIQCKNKTEAKQKLLRLNSQYGRMTKESVLEFAEDLELNFDEVLLPFGTIDFSEEPLDLNYKDETGMGGGYDR